MFKFSWLRSPSHSQKPKKTVQLPTEAMQKTLEDHNANNPYKDPAFSQQVDKRNNANQFPSSAGHDSKSEGLKSMNSTDSEHDHETKAMRKCVSVGTGLAAYQDKGDSSSSHEYQEARASDSPQISSNLVNLASDSSHDLLQQSDEEDCDSYETQLSGECTDSPHAFVKSNSLPYLKALDPRWDDKSVTDDAGETFLEQENENDSVGQADKSDGDEAYDYVGLAKDWIVPAVDEHGKGKIVQEGLSDCQWDELPNEVYKIKRTEKWVMDLQHSYSFEETNLDHSGQYDKNTKSDAKAIVGMDAAKRYISSLNPAATTAQLANHGLVVIPFLSAFSSLKALNLSGNSIVRITVGALPRGLHILNLSKNSISTIEGLRDLTRLRVLDLSYNRIIRIGHGLALCSSLKELYLAGNKISEVEGLHRLLKLSVLDLRFNKLSTTKSLGQLAANYSSLQAISLEGNPAQKNIGDEQLKKFIIGLLPHITYFNRQSIKFGAMKDSADRAARLGISAHQSERGLKSTQGRKSQPMSGRGRHVRLPPSGVKAGGDRRQFADVSSQLVSFRPDLGMRRIHSEGLLRAV